MTITSSSGSASHAPIRPLPNSTLAPSTSSLTPAAQKVEVKPLSPTLEKQSIVNLPGGAIAAKLQTEARDINKAAQDKPSWLNQAVYTDPSFTGQTISQFTSSLLNIPEKDLEETLFSALPKDKQAPESRAFIKQSLSNSINASGAVMMFVNTDEGLKLIAANSQRRKMVIQSNGSCEKGESFKETARREFFEELGNPPETGILGSIIAGENNCLSIVGVNKIGENAAQIAARMVEAEGKKHKLYLNASAIYVNHEVVSSKALNAELELLNHNLGIAAKFYNPAVSFLYGDRAANWNDTQKITEASQLITHFQDQCSAVITSNFEQIFSAFSKNPQDAKAVKTALGAIVDLTENDKIEMHDETSLKSSMELFLTNKDAFKESFFAPGFESIFTHQGQRTRDEFFNDLKGHCQLAGT